MIGKIEEMKVRRELLLERLKVVHKGDALWDGLLMLVDSSLEAVTRSSARQGMSSDDRAYADGYRAALIDLNDQLLQALKNAKDDSHRQSVGSKSG